MPMIRRFVLIFVLACAAALLIWWVRQEPAPGPGSAPGRSRAPAVAVQVAPITTGLIQDIRSFSGSLAPRAQFIVAPKVAGRLERLSVDLGDPVRRGQVVARLDDAEYVQQVEQARAELLVALANLDESRSELDIAEKEFVRIESLRGQKVTSQSELDLSRSKYLAQQARMRVAEAQVDQRKASLRAAEVRLGYTTITASWPAMDQPDPSRVVGERFVDEGATLSANTSMLSVLDISWLRAVFHVAERDYPRLHVGQQARVMVDAFPEQIFEGHVSRIAPVFQEASRQARIEVELANPRTLLKPGMFARIELELGRSDNALLAPTAALVRREGRWALFVLDSEESVDLVFVRKGIEHGGRTQILEPSDLQGQVVTLGQHLLEDGSGVNVVQEPDEANQISADESGQGLN
jgi:RND family efflux transporter MFP subunit